MDGAGRTVVKNRRKISDFLADVDDSDGADDAAAVASSHSPPETPRLRVGLPAMFTCAGIRFVGLGRKGRGGGGCGRKEVAAAAEKSEAASSVDSSGAAGSNAGSSGGSATASMGMGLLFLLARTCVELNKMAEVRAQMEALLEEMRGELARTRTKATDDRRHADVTRTIRGVDLLPSTASPWRAPATEADMDDARAASSSSSSSFIMETTVSSSDADGASSEDDSALAAAATMDAVGAGRRPYQLSCNSEQEASESSSSDDEFIELDGGFGAGDRPRRHPGEEEDDEEQEQEQEQEQEEHELDGSDDVREGVSAVELERRLHELLHRRSRERIERLESSLRRAERKLVEKEMEARLWKDTAELALQPPHRPDVLLLPSSTTTNYSS